MACGAISEPLSFVLSSFPLSSFAAEAQGGAVSPEQRSPGLSGLVVIEGSAKALRGREAVMAGW